MNIFERIHFLHRVWRYRLRGEKFGVSFLLSRELTGKTAVDIGANRGVYSYWMNKKVGPQGFVISFEPQPELDIYLNQVKKVFDLKQIEVAKLGLSSVAGERVLVRPKNHWGGASLEGSPNEDKDLLEIRVTTLDDYFHNHPARPIRFIKCDVEGHEYDVFQGGKRILQQDRPDLLFECFDVRNPKCDVFSYLRDLEYDGFFFYQRGFVPIAKYETFRKSIHEKALFNFVFVPKESSHTLNMYCV
ncbi:MAG: FkbM family methyltransferase [Nitrospira sp.]|nr:FkbM family methyltransferase [Candidatus Manganitrophaceae bacterium]HIL35343.1 FkbM family methyltransferase [Candidatus Manganitrophaceae bacterium]